MIRTAKMVQLSAVVLEKYFDRVTRELLSLGQMDFISVKEVSPSLARSLRDVRESVSSAEIKDLRKKVESIMAAGRIEYPSLKHADIKPLTEDDFRRMSDEAAVLETEMTGLRRRQQDLQTDLLHLEEGATYETEKVLAVVDGDEAKFGTPYVEGAKVVATVGAVKKGEKVKVYKFHRRKGYRRTQGHREQYQEIKFSKVQG